ncbi:hypothetical protein [Azospirillum thermophilum]|uniref:hypothetical protein n=1 Tax=Azospirillum thermophilum TaxID=2202148 RepID=UPI0015E884F1|nr:hypothetical protein [Azospirillum thermophilum]
MRFRTHLIALAVAAVLPVLPGTVRADTSLSADEIVGLEVEGALGEELGQIAAVNESPQGETTLLVEASGMLDVGHAFFTVRKSELSPGEEEDVLVYPRTAADVIRHIRKDRQVAGHQAPARARHADRQVAERPE